MNRKGGFNRPLDFIAWKYQQLIVTYCITIFILPLIQWMMMCYSVIWNPALSCATILYIVLFCFFTRDIKNIRISASSKA